MSDEPSIAAKRRALLAGLRKADKGKAAAPNETPTEYRARLWRAALKSGSNPNATTTGVEPPKPTDAAKSAMWRRAIKQTRG